MFRRRHPDDDPAAAIRASIAAITSARESATRNAAGALVNEAQVRQALGRQRDELIRSVAEVETAIAAAQRIATDALTNDGADAAAPYELQVNGLQTQRDVLALALEQIDGLSEVSGEHVEQGRRLLVRGRHDLDAALREQLVLLAAVERLDRARLVAAARLRRSGPDAQR